ncbi:MAG: spondin domain-containing protein [Planctomycetota bacterium]
MSIAFGSNAVAQMSGDIRVEFEHGNQTDFSFTPLWFGFHNENFDAFDIGDDVQGTGIESIAEVGVIAPFEPEFAAADGTPGDIQGAAGGTPGPPPVQPGETGVGFVTPMNPSAYQYFSFLSMVVPTNDTFIGNEDPLAFRVFDDDDNLIDASGNVTTERVIQIFATGFVFDAGTEVNDADNGVAFAFGQDGSLGAVEGGLVTAVTDLSEFVGISDGTNFNIDDGIDFTGQGELLATITISVVPEPGSALLLVAGGLAAVFRRRSA